ncbi:protein ABHD15 [Pygocentrus nattereri]|uniref:Protein ABHD15 n=1 Tax=Pygocentrus nattereri TaxID=42514 RepID=A0A3B4DMG6_PYGNA|nr:protein ABHD15 [Pygocentrus nattereri]XP_037402311.1 protein ABHD15 [Pygocentrus nattereri]
MVSSSSAVLLLVRVHVQQQHYGPGAFSVLASTVFWSSLSSLLETVQMLEWMGAVCIVLVLVVSAWPVLKRLAEACASDTEHKVQGPGAAAGAAPPLAFICKPSALANYLLQHCKSFCKPDSIPAWTWRSVPSLQTVFGALWPHDSTVHFVRDHLQLSDDGLVALDWAVGGGSGTHHKRRRTSSNSTSPILLIIPNSFGKITRNVLKLCEVGLAHGYLPVVFNRRSQNGTPLSTVKLQQFGDPADLREAVRYIRYRQPAGRLYAVSESTGSGLLLSYLGECGSSSYMTAAACLSPIFRCQSWFENGPTWPFNWALLLYQKICLSRYRTALGELIHTESLFSSGSLRAMEEVLFCQAGLKGAQVEGAWEAYWERNDPLRDVDEVAIPVLCVCSRDDPVRGEPQATLPWELFETNPHFFLLLTALGGHCGFSFPEEGPVLWSHQAVLEFFRASTEFFAAEERLKQSARRRGLSGVGKTFRHRSVSTCKRLPACSHNIHAIYNWQRSYTR